VTPSRDPAGNLLIVDDDPTFCRVLARAMEGRGYAVRVAHDGEQALAAASLPTNYAVVDLKLPGMSGLGIVQGLRSRNAAMKIVVLTGYASIATAIEAIKLGATHYLAKPARADDIVAAFGRGAPDPRTAIRAERRAIGLVEWDHIQETLLEHDGNISASARELGMHRRTLQRKLAKRPPRT
jgi:two-component system response regulator RegA